MGFFSKAVSWLVVGTADPMPFAGAEIEQKDYDYGYAETTIWNGMSLPATFAKWTDSKSYAKKSQALLSNSVSKACITKRATAVGNVDVKVVKGNDAVKRLITSPNHREPTLQAAMQVWETTLSIGGDLYWFWDLSLGENPKLHNFRPDLVQYDPATRTYSYDPTGYFNGKRKPEYLFTQDMSGKTVSCQKLVGGAYQAFKGAIQHVCYYDPRTALEGAGAGDSALRAVDIMNALDELVANKAAAGGSKAGFFECVGSPTEADYASIEAQMARLNPSGNLNILPPSLKFNAAQLTFQEMNVSETRNQMAKDICTALDVPAELVNEANATHANARGKDKIFYRNFIGPESHRLVGHLQAGLRMYVDAKAELMVDESSVQHLEDDQLDAIKALASTGCFTINEIRAVRGLAPREDGDVLCGAKQIPQGQPEEKPKGEVSFNADAGNRGDNNDN